MFFHDLIISRIAWQPKGWEKLCKLEHSQFSGLSQLLSLQIIGSLSDHMITMAVKLPFSSVPPGFTVGIKHLAQTIQILINHRLPVQTSELLAVTVNKGMENYKCSECPDMFLPK